MEKLLTKLVLGLIFVTPLFFLPFTHELFETPKSYLLTAGGLLIFSVALVTKKSFKNHLKILSNNTLWQLVLGLLLVLTLTAFFSGQLAPSLVGSVNQKNGLLMLYALGAVATVISYLVTNQQLARQKIFTTLLYSITFASVMGITKYLLEKVGIIGVEGLLFDNREVSTFGQPNFFGFFVALAVLFVPYEQTINRKIIFYLILMCAEYLTFSKSGWFIFGLNTIAILVADKQFNTSKKYLVYFAIVFLILLNLGLLLTKTQSYEKFLNSDKSYQYRRVTALSGNPSKAEEDRLIIWRVSIAALKERPLLGYGKGNIDVALYEKLQETKVAAKGMVDSSHNMLLDMALEGGIFSALLLVGIMVILLVQGIKERNFTVIFALVSIFLNGLVHNTSNVVYFILFILIGIYKFNLNGSACRDLQRRS